MPYAYIEDIATADVAFEAWDEDLERMFVEASVATLNVLVENVQSVSCVVEKVCQVEDEFLDIVLYKFLERIIYFKDAENLLLRAIQVKIIQEAGMYYLEAIFQGEIIDHKKHPLYLDIKAITLHELKVFQKNGQWKSRVIVDV